MSSNSAKGRDDQRTGPEAARPEPHEVANAIRAEPAIANTTARCAEAGSLGVATAASPFAFQRPQGDPYLPGCGEGGRT
jgi:hypothetical protein